LSKSSKNAVKSKKAVIKLVLQSLNRTNVVKNSFDLNSRIKHHSGRTKSYVGESPSWLRHWILIPACEGSNPSSPATHNEALESCQHRSNNETTFPRDMGTLAVPVQANRQRAPREPSLRSMTINQTTDRKNITALASKLSCGVCFSFDNQLEFSWRTKT